MQNIQGKFYCHDIYNIQIKSVDMQMSYNTSTLIVRLLLVS